MINVSFLFHLHFCGDLTFLGSFQALLQLLHFYTEMVGFTLCRFDFFGGKRPDFIFY